MSAPFIFLGEGRNRLVFLHGNFVVKVPRNDYGCYDNEREADISRSFRHGNGGIHYARCRLIPGSFILVMELVDLVFKNPKENGWWDFVDCQQVGLTRFGKLVAYDFGTC